MNTTATVGLVGYGLGTSVVMATTNDYHMLLTLQGITVLVLALILMNRSFSTSKGLTAWIGVLGTSLVARLLSVAITKGSPVNKAAKFRRWDSLATVLGFAVALGYLMTSVVPRRSVAQYMQLTAVGIPSATAATLALLDSNEKDLGMYATLSREAYKMYTHRDASTDTRVLITRVDTTLIVAFAGTASKENVKTDLKISDVQFTACNTPLTRVHAGFHKAWLSVRDHVIEAVSSADRVVYCGHSLGGALATLAALDTGCADPKKHIECISFGAPQVGDELFVDQFNARVNKSVRVINPLDPIPKALSAQLAHVKGVYFVSGGLNPHSMVSYETEASKPHALRVLGILVPVVYVVLMYSVLRVAADRRAARYTTRGV